jgi:hypothetical protein
VSDRRLVLVDRTGIVLSDGETGGKLPRIILPTDPMRVGEKLKDTRVAVALAFIEGLGTFSPVTSMEWQEGWYFLAKVGKTDIFIPQDKPMSGLLATLQTLLAGFRIKGTLPTVVDLRFDKPIVKF